MLDRVEKDVAEVSTGVAVAAQTAAVAALLGLAQAVVVVVRHVRLDDRIAQVFRHQGVTSLADPLGA